MVNKSYSYWREPFVRVQDLTITIASQRSEDVIILEEDVLQRSTINVESFVDEQEWRLYDEVETFKGCVSKFYQGDDVENCVHPTFSCRTHATRRAGFYITNIFVVMVKLLFRSLTLYLDNGAGDGTVCDTDTVLVGSL